VWFGEQLATFRSFAVKEFGFILLFDFADSPLSKLQTRAAMAKAAFNKKKSLFTRKLDLNLRKKLVKCYIWSMALYGAETWTLRTADQKF
jgi:hypothetical protein